MSEILMTVLGISFIFLMTTSGAALVFFFRKEISPRLNTVFLGLASGIMIAASIWSLLLPSLEQSESAGYGAFAFVPAAVGFALGGLFLVIIDRIVPHLRKNGEEEGLSSSLCKSTKMMLAITIHNVPEGLAVGFAFGAAAAIGEPAAYAAALGLAIGIGIQNFPEGAAVSLPMRAATGKRGKSFVYGMLSGAVEPIFAIVGFLLAAYVSVLQPWLLAFAAGAMIFVVAEDLIPDAKLSAYPHLSTWAVMIGFLLMMILDVALG